MAYARTDLPLNGERESGADVRTQNVMAAVAIANVVKTSFGPVGLDKMLVDDIGDVTITNDGATILKLLEVEHPAAKVLVELADLQDKEVGDGTTTVVILAAELLKYGNELIKQKIHPSTVIQGFRLAMQEAVKFIRKIVVHTNELDRKVLEEAAATCISSKVIGGEEGEFFSKLAVDTIKKVKRNEKGKAKYPVSGVTVLKAYGKSSKESVLIDGCAVNCVIASEEMPKEIKGCKVAILEIDLMKEKMRQGIQIVTNNPEEIDKFKEEEMKIVIRRVQMIIESGANVVFISGGLDELCTQYFVEKGIAVAKRVSSRDLHRIGKATGAKVISTLVNLEGIEEFDKSNLGECDTFKQEKVGDNELIVLRGCSDGGSATVLLRGANATMLDEMSRSLHDALCVLRRVLESNTVIVGGGATDVALSVHLNEYATTLEGREQLAVQAFADALCVIPKVLAQNAAKDASELLSQMRKRHYGAQKIDKPCYDGLDLIKGEIRNNLEAGVVEPSVSKVKCIKFATEAAITILRIDDLIKLNPTPQPKQGQDY
ncbi:T-complex protein 1 subunit alpha, putative [Entamoeba histolytica HM-3:IMSS]|uniref:T-complex protein 1 subunit alpha n=2 Tax=Entamoeba histolytica TaxID=5759 RepID=M2S8Q2_ENTHI|nr:T-complex protein subunit alpha, putative [Entamoeba histolytica KU27]EMS11015.1 T-complex protein 1 subunit alpha, putative [Entamoeba histolytica HM-3:IMSS]